jgi:hypothetical protein
LSYPGKDLPHCPTPVYRLLELLTGQRARSTMKVKQDHLLEGLIFLSYKKLDRHKQPASVGPVSKPPSAR